MNQIEKICEQQSSMSNPVEDGDSIYLSSSNGDICKFDGQMKTVFHLPGQPSSIAIDNEHSIIYVSDLARQCILKRFQEPNDTEVIVAFLSEYEGMPFLGPNSLLLSPQKDQLFFTDSGPFGETAIDNSKGSLFVVDLENGYIKPLALYCLSYPAGICFGNDSQTVYLCETGKNRILRFVQSANGIYHFSVYIQMQGRYGPIACAISANNYLFVARYEFKQASEDGLISVYNTNGVNVENIQIPKCPELSGLAFSNVKKNVLYVTENTNTPSLLKLTVQVFDEKDDNKKEKEKYK